MPNESSHFENTKSRTDARDVDDKLSGQRGKVATV
jgi:hypothetical protein